MKYILIFIMFTEGVGEMTFTAEFDQKAACERAMEQIQPKVRILDNGKCQMREGYQ